MNTLILAIALLLTPAEAGSQTSQPLDIELTPINKILVFPNASITEDGGLKLKDIFTSLSGYTHNLNLYSEQSNHLANQTSPVEISWEKTILIETSYILPLTAHRQSISFKGVTRINRFVDQNNLQVESQLTEVKGINRSVLWVHLVLEFHILLLIGAIISLFALRAKPAKPWTTIMVVIPVFGPISFVVHLIRTLKRVSWAKN